MSRYRQPQLQEGENWSYLFISRLNIWKFWCLTSCSLYQWFNVLIKRRNNDHLAVQELGLKLGICLSGFRRPTSMTHFSTSMTHLSTSMTHFKRANWDQYEHFITLLIMTCGRYVRVSRKPPRPPQPPRPSTHDPRHTTLEPRLI